MPTFREFLELFRDDKKILFNIELKDYPADSGDFAFESARRILSVMEEYGITERSVVNSFSGELNEWLADTYGDRLRIHAYSPQEKMGTRQKRFVYTYAYCVCMFGTPGQRVWPAKYFDLAKSYGVEPWSYFPVEDPTLIDAALAAGTRLFTINDPAWLMAFSGKKGFTNKRLFKLYCENKEKKSWQLWQLSAWA